MARVYEQGNPSNYCIVKPLKRKKRCVFYFNNPKDSKGNPFGWDLPTQTIFNNCTSDVEKFKEEYAPNEPMLDKNYIVPWLSIRVGQKITLEVTKKTNREKEYQHIDFEPNDLFTITYDTEELREATKVTITCKATSDTPTQLQIKADGDPSGAINIFHPEPKTVNIRWIGTLLNKGDNDNIKDKVNLRELHDFFKKSLSPVLIDVTFDNEEMKKFDITSYTPQHNIAKSYYKNVQDSLLGNNDRIATEDEAKLMFINNLSKLYVFKEGEEGRNTNFSKTILLFLTQLLCSDVDSETNGISATGEGLSLMFLKNEKSDPEVEIPHEIMHAIGLPHTFTDPHSDNIPQTHTFMQNSTENYMDYDNEKKGLFGYQWLLLHESKYIK